MSDSHGKAVAVIEQANTEVMHPVVRAALAQSPDPATLRELLAVQREYEANEARKAYTSALARLKRDLPTVIGRDKTVDYATSKGRTRYTHTSLAAAMDAITGPLTQHGFSLAWAPSTDKGGVTVTCRLTHSAGHSEESSITAPPDNSGHKSPAQGIASTITLLSRYTALSLLGIATADMQEPTGEPVAPRSDAVNTKKNMKAAGALKKYGRTRVQAEAYLGRPVSQWTQGDVEKLAEWVKTPLADEVDHDYGPPPMDDDEMPDFGDEDTAEGAA